MKVGRVTARAASRTWPTASAAVSVVVATHDRMPFLDGLLAALAAQSADVEVVIADDGSTDGTWAWLQRHADTTELPLLALRLDHTGGPSLPRNTAAAHARAGILAVTDDDCLPEPGWAQALAHAVDAGVAIAQGRTLPVAEQHGPWDRTVRVESPSGLFETCNLGFATEEFVALGGFPVVRVLGDLPRGFGEDALLGAHAARAGGFGWAPEALVRHRWIPATYTDHLRGVRRLSGFPWLARELPEVAGLLRGGVFLSRRTMAYDAAVAAVVVAATTRRAWPLVAALPWVHTARNTARWRVGRPLATRMAQEALADTVACAALVTGSVRHRRVVL